MMSAAAREPRKRPHDLARPMPVRVSRLGRDDETERARWDRYVESSPGGSLYHLTRWQRVIEDVFGHETFYWQANDAEGRLLGVLPLVRLKSLLFGDYQVSMPYFNYGGAIGVAPEVEEALMRRAAEAARGLGCRHLEFRDEHVRSGGWPVREDKVVMERELPSDPEVLWKDLGGKLRAQVRRPYKEDGETEIRIGGSDLLDPFYSVFARNMRDLGTPVYPRRFFAAILESFPELSRIVVVRHQRQAVAAAFLVEHKQRMEIPWASSLREFNRSGVNMLLYWEVLKLAIERGNRVFDFGRSTVGGGTYRFKQQWGAKPRPLHWHYWLRDGGEPPRLNPDNPKYRLAIRAWQRLPLPVTTWLGPKIVRNLP